MWIRILPLQFHWDKCNISGVYCAVCRWCGLQVNTELRWDSWHLVWSRPQWTNWLLKRYISLASVGCCSDTTRRAHRKSGRNTHKHTADKLSGWHLNTHGFLFKAVPECVCVCDCFQKLLREQHQPHPPHHQRALAVLSALVQRGVCSLLRGPTYPQ